MEDVDSPEEKQIEEIDEEERQLRIVSYVTGGNFISCTCTCNCKILLIVCFTFGYSRLLEFVKC